ncbi:AAA family ATPase, partial [Candidatus Woesearchaeota archaeon]
MKLEDLHKTFEYIFNESGKVIVGQKEVLKQITVALLADSHALLEGYPGLAKTLAVKTMAELMDLKFSRIQNTPDLMPSDITGTYIIEEVSGKRSFKFQQGPIFANIVLADEINRATPKTQSALLEAMQERQVTIGNSTFKLDLPFFVLATQNPIEQEGTYPLPEAQSDRFLLKIKVG